MGSGEGGEMQECCLMKLYFVAAKKYLPIKANSGVAYEKIRLMNATSIKTQLIRPRQTHAILVLILNAPCVGLQFFTAFYSLK